MATTATIDLLFSGDELPASVSLLTLGNAGTGADVSAAAGLTLPAAFTAGTVAGEWSLTFADTGITEYAYTYRITWADGSHTDESGTEPGATPLLTSRALIEATGKVNADAWADIDADADAAKIQDQFDRVVDEAQDAARESADDAGALALWPLDPADAQYPALVRAATDFAVARLQQVRPEPVAAGKEPAGVTGERVARQRMVEVWEAIHLRADTATAAAPVADEVTVYPAGYSRFTTYGCGPICG